MLDEFIRCLQSFVAHILSQQGFRTAYIILTITLTGTPTIRFTIPIFLVKGKGQLGLTQNKSSAKQSAEVPPISEQGTKIRFEVFGAGCFCT